MATDKLHIDSLVNYFKDDSVFGNRDIIDFYKQTEKNIKESTINWRIYTMIQKGILKRVGRGTFAIGKSKKYIPEISTKVKAIYSRLKKEFPYLDICIWNTSVFNEFMVHQPGRFYHLVEVEKEATESVFFFLKESKLVAFHEPTKDILDKYLPEGREVFIVMPLVSEAPLQKATGVNTITIEKMLVDLFSNDVIFFSQQGAEMRNIFSEAFAKFTINQSKLLRYADRRRKKESLQKFLESFPKIKLKFRQQ